MQQQIFALYFPLLLSLNIYIPLLYYIVGKRKVLLRASYPTSNVDLKNNQRMWLDCCILKAAHTMFSLLYQKSRKRVYHLKIVT